MENTVEQKYVYIITNTINNKKYVGQSKHPDRRFQEHCVNHSSYIKDYKKRISPLNGAINRYGKENFTLDILYYGPDYNEQEKFFIEYYNTKVPNGYNIASGGSYLPKGFEGEYIGTHKLSLTQVKEIQEKLINGQSFQEIYEDYKDIITLDTIRRINNGKLWKTKNLNYPLQTTEPDRYEEILPLIIDDLKNTNLTYSELKKKYNCTQICNINTGRVKLAHKYTDTFPIRKNNFSKYSEDQINNVLDELQNGNLTFAQISEKTGVKISTISAINSGTEHKQTSMDYPIRKHT